MRAESNAYALDSTFLDWANYSDFKIPLLSYNFKKSLISTIVYLYLISYIKLFRVRITTSLLLVNLAIFLLIVLLY